MNPEKDVLLRLNELRERLGSLMDPKVLNKLADLLESLGGDKDNSLLERYDYFVKHGEFGKDCRYARMAKDYFLAESGDEVIELINWLHEHWTSRC